VSAIICPHGGIASAIPINYHVFVQKHPIITIAEFFPVTGCPFIIGCHQSPCILVKWIVPASRILIGGKPAILHSSTGICESSEEIPQGSPLIITTQNRVKGV